MYVSRAVATIRDDPVPGETVELVLELQEEADPAAVARAVQQVAGTVERQLQFDALLVTVPQRRVDEVCALDGLSGVQTAAAIGIHADEAEEDVDVDR